MATDIVEKLISDLETKAKEISKIYGTLKALQEYDPSITFPDITTLISSDGELTSSGRSYKIEPGEFYGKTQTQATEAFLRKIGKPASLDSIYMALMAGGIKFQGTNGKNALNVQLTRANSWFAKIPGPETTFGLREWYGRKRGRPSGGGKEEPEEVDIPSEPEEKE